MKYVMTEELEYDWEKWLIDGDTYAWERLLGQVYLICQGIATKFHPVNEDEHSELAHEAFALIVAKIKDGRLVADDRAPAFNLLTTAIFRQLYSLKNRDSRRKVAIGNYAKRFVLDPKIRNQLSCPQLNQVLGSLSTICR